MTERITRAGDMTSAVGGVIVAGVFDRESDADAAVRALESQGFNREVISVLSQPPGTPPHRSADETSANSRLVAGTAIGGAVGGLAGLLVGLSTVALPGIGGLLVAGPIALALAGAATGGAMGAVAGSISGLGIPDEHAASYEDRVRRGGIFVSLRVDNRLVDEVSRTLMLNGARDVNSYVAKL
ncbi:MAG: hypothetical protein HY329_16620 [Chloroflexi bacterium]|nr:hypothetical protein [Chloroflexota bacterium]